MVFLHLLTKCEARLCLLNAHDTTVNFIRLALRVQDFTWPDFGYSVSFEVYQGVPSSNEAKLMVLLNLRPVILHALYPQVLIPLCFHPIRVFQPATIDNHFVCVVSALYIPIRART